MAVGCHKPKDNKHNHFPLYQDAGRLQSPDTRPWTFFYRRRTTALVRKAKVQFTPEQATKAQRGGRGLGLSFLLPRRYMGVGGQRHAPAALHPGKTRNPLYRRLGGSQGRSGRVRKISPPNAIPSPDRPARSESLHRLSYAGP